MQIHNQIKAKHKAHTTAFSKFTDSTCQPHPIFSGHSCHDIEGPRICTTPAETQLPDQALKKCIDTASVKKIKKARSQFRRKFKRGRKEQLKCARLVNQELARQRFDPDRFTFDAEKEMQLVFAASKGFAKTLVFDLDGPLLPYRQGSRSHRKPKIRPHLEELVDAVKDIANLFVFSAGNPARTSNLLNKYLPKGFSGYFDRSHLQRGRKSLKSLEWKGHDLILIDDDPKAVHFSAKSMHMTIKRWTGEDDDIELQKLLQQLQKQWSCN